LKILSFFKRSADRAIDDIFSDRFLLNPVSYPIFTFIYPNCDAPCGHQQKEVHPNGRQP
jgi:hypothetical protein